MATDSIFDLPEFKPYQLRFMTRQRELARRKSYYDGSVYKNVRQQLGWLGPRLYKGIKPLYLPLARAVDVDAGIIPGGWKLDEDMPQAELWQAAIDTIFNWSNWSINGVLYIHYGAMYGVSNLKIADLREARRVVIAPVNPACLLLDESGPYGSDTPDLAIWVEIRLDDQGEKFEYAEVIDAGMIRTFANGRPMAFEEREPEYTNELGFVPYVEIDHIKTGEELGEATYQKAIDLLNEVNELASYLADIIKKHAEPQWAVSGAEPSDLVKSGDNVWFLPGEAKATPMVAGIDIPGVLDFIREVRDQVIGALPELSFDELKSKTQIATATLELQLMELVLKIKRTRPNYDYGLAEALRLAGRAGAGMGLGELAVLDDEALEFDDERPVLPLDRETQLRLDKMEQDLKTGARDAQGNTPQPSGGMNGRGNNQQQPTGDATGDTAAA